LEMMAHREGKSAKYSDEQPRDERGRFGSGDSGGGDSQGSVALSENAASYVAGQNLTQAMYWASKEGKDSNQDTKLLRSTIDEARIQTTDAQLDHNYQPAIETTNYALSVAQTQGLTATADSLSAAAGLLEQAQSAADSSKSFKAAIPPCKVPDGAKQAAERGLKLRAEFNRGGTAVGANRARQLIRSSQVSPEIARRVYSYFKRHEVDKRASGFHQGGEGYPSAGLIAWLLWGGDAMFSAVRSWHDHHDK